MTEPLVPARQAIEFAFTAHEAGKREGLNEAALPPIRRAVFPFSTGSVEMVFPDRLPPDEVDDLEAYFALLIKRLRAARAESPSSDADAPTGQSIGEGGDEVPPTDPKDPS